MLSKPSICIISPALAAANNGNWQTAKRWQQMLSSDYHVEIMLQWDGRPFDAMLALHARRSADSIAQWSAQFPDKLIVLALTGTDLYRDIAVDPLAQQSLKLAHRLVVLQDMGPKSLPAEYQNKCQVIFQSTPRRQFVEKTTHKLRALMVGHLRSEKSPETYFAAARALAHRTDIVLDHIGAPLDADLGEQARQLAAEVPTYRYLGEQTHASTRARIARAHVLVHPSRMEGGAHVVMEAVMSGTPVLASRIDGNVGMLGADYAGYFDCGDADQLANALIACREGQNLPSSKPESKLNQLARQCSLREKLFEPLSEKTALNDLFKSRSISNSLKSKHTMSTASNSQTSATTAISMNEPKLTSLSHGGGCGCKIAPGVLSEILKGITAMPMPKELMVGIETADDAAVYKLNDTQALIATTDFFMPIVDNPFDFGRIAATNAISDVYAMGGKPILALALVGMPINVLSTETIAKVLEGGASVCRAAGIPIAGGHTIDSVEAIYGLVALGLVHPDHVKRNADAKPGDVLVLGKPIGVGIMSAALKKGDLDDAGYAKMIEITTKLNTPGPDLSVLPGVHALTDITGFGLAGHTLELARGAKVNLEIDYATVPLLPGVRDMAAKGTVTGASGRNWVGYGKDVTLPKGFADEDLALITDPQTSGGLLVSCDPAVVPQVLAIFKQHGFDEAAAIGRVVAGPGKLVIL